MAAFYQLIRPNTAELSPRSPKATHMANSHHIEKTRAIFKPDNLVTLKDVSDNFFMELNRDFGSFAGHVLVSQFAFDEAWPTWEIHPAGDELVFLLSGDTDLVLASEEGQSEDIVRVSNPGDYVVVPKGTWHTARPYAPTSMLFLTPGEGTINALKPGGDPL